MYPFIRMIWQNARIRKAPRLGLFEEHRSTHYCMPWDLDIWLELNNGRTLTLFDLGRIPLCLRNGLFDILRREKMAMPVAGAAVRYRRRVTVFERMDMRSRVIGWDDKFVYSEQSMWTRDGTCANHILLRNAFTKSGRMVAPAEVFARHDPDLKTPPLPGWVQAWADADHQRPWPPMGPPMAANGA